jgi:hypothetical protein
MTTKTKGRYDWHRATPNTSGFCPNSNQACTCKATGNCVVCRRWMLLGLHLSAAAAVLRGDHGG